MIAIGLILTACESDDSLTINQEWIQISNWGQENLVKCIAVEGETVFVGTADEIYRSTNNGDTWIKLSPYNQTPNLNGLFRIHIKNLVLFGGEPVEGFITSVDNGNTWNKVPNSIPETETVNSIASNSNFIFIGTRGSGVLRSGDNGESWESVFQTNPIGESVWNIEVDSNNVLIYVYGKGLFLSTDNGMNWKNITGNIDFQHGSGTIYIKGQTIFFGTDKFYKSNDQGASWQEIKAIENGIEATASVTSIISNNDIIYASTGAGVFYTTNNGEVWTKLPNRNEFFDPLFRLASNDKFIFGVDNYNVHRISKVK